MHELATLVSNFHDSGPHRYVPKLLKYLLEYSQNRLRALLCFR